MIKSNKGNHEFSEFPRLMVGVSGNVYLMTSKYKGVQLTGSSQGSSFNLDSIDLKDLNGPLILENL